MITTKATAQAIAATYQSGEEARINAFINNLAQSGQVGGSYTVGPNLGAPAIAAAQASFAASGWTATFDVPTRTFTIS